MSCLHSLIAGEPVCDCFVALWHDVALAFFPTLVHKLFVAAENILAWVPTETRRPSPPRLATNSPVAATKSSKIRMFAVCELAKVSNFSVSAV
eukprot:9407767-Pyramimonas_sp.AAC.1